MMDQVIVFTIDDQRFALPVTSIERIIRVVEIIRLPQLPDYFSGIINIQGVIVPVLNLRNYLGFNDRDILLSDQIIVTHTNSRSLAFLVDRVIEVTSDYITTPVAEKDCFFIKAHINNVIKQKDRMIFMLADLSNVLTHTTSTLLNKEMQNVQASSSNHK